MRYIEGRVEGIKITYIGGGSRGWAWQLMSDLAKEEQLNGTVKLYDIDYEAARHNMAIGNGLKVREDVKSKWDYEAVATLDEALEDADFVIISILPGTFKEMASDVHTPEKYGIYQAVGDTVGPGGIVRGLRTVPMFVEIAKAIEANCPKAWVINYTNPMSLCVKTLYEAFPQIKAFGCCHEVFNTQKLLAAALEDMEGIKGVTREEIKINVLGINHFTWLDKASYKNIDLLPIYERFVDKYHLTGFETEKVGHWMNDHFGSCNRVQFDLFKRYGLIAAAGDRHLAEFMQGNWYIENPAQVMEWKYSLTPVSWRKEDLKERLAKSERLVKGEEDFTIEDTGEEGVRQIKAILGLEDLVSNVNVPNKGQITNLPLGAIVETNAVFRRDEVTPVLAGSLPAGIASIAARHIANTQMTLEAALEKDKEKAFLAFTNDPLVMIGVEDARELLDEMLINTAEYLKGWVLQESIEEEV